MGPRIYDMMTRGRGGVWLSLEYDDVIYEQPLKSMAVFVSKTNLWLVEGVSGWRGRVAGNEPE